jgi:FkbM family methyltransferase
MLENFKLIEKNVRLNMLQNRVKTFNFAVGIKKGFASLYIGDSGLASLYSQGERHVSVKTVTLEDIFSINKLDKIDFLKVDVEGAEWDILRPTGRNHLAKIKKIVIECHSSELRQRIAGFLRNEGFLIQTTQGGHHTLSYIYGRRKECQ